MIAALLNGPSRPSAILHRCAPGFKRKYKKTFFILAIPLIKLTFYITKNAPPCPTWLFFTTFVFLQKGV